MLLPDCQQNTCGPKHFQRTRTPKSQHHEHDGACLGPQFPSCSPTYEVPPPLQNFKYVEVSRTEKRRRPNFADDAGQKKDCPKPSATCGREASQTRPVTITLISDTRKRGSRGSKGRAGGGPQLRRHPHKVYLQLGVRPRWTTAPRPDFLILPGLVLLNPDAIRQRIGRWC